MTNINLIALDQEQKGKSLKKAVAENRMSLGKWVRGGLMATLVMGTNPALVQAAIRSDLPTCDKAEKMIDGSAEQKDWSEKICMCESLGDGVKSRDIDEEEFNESCNPKILSNKPPVKKITKPEPPKPEKKPEVQPEKPENKGPSEQEKAITACREAVKKAKEIKATGLDICAELETAESFLDDNQCDWATIGEKETATLKKTFEDLEKQFDEQSKKVECGFKIENLTGEDWATIGLIAALVMAGGGSLLLKRFGNRYKQEAVRLTEFSETLIADLQDHGDQIIVGLSQNVPRTTDLDQFDSSNPYTHFVNHRQQYHNRLRDYNDLVKYRNNHRTV